MHADAQSRRWSRTARIGLVAVGLLCVLLLTLHAPFVRALALDYLSRAAMRAGVRVEAERLDYNLIALRFGLQNVRVAANGRAEPFFAARAVSGRLSPRILSGVVHFDEIAVDGGSIHIDRTADGNLNLPGGSSPSAAEPAPVPITRLVAPNLAIDYADAERATAIHAPAVSLDLSAHGHVASVAPIDLSLPSMRVRLTRLDGSVGFDGRDLVLSNLAVETSEARARLDGRLAIVRPQPAADLQLAAEADLDRVARWWTPSRDFGRGTARVNGSIAGALSAPVVDVQVGSSEVSWSGLDASDVAAHVRLDGERLDVQQGRLMVAGGSVTVAGQVEWNSDRTRVNVAWQDVELSRVWEPWIGKGLVPAGLTSGDASASGALGGDDWQGLARVRVGVERAGPGRVPVPGETTLRLTGRQWSIDARHAVGGEVPLTASLRGVVSGDRVAESTVTGRIAVEQTDLDAISRALSASGLVEPFGSWPTGALRATATIGGTLARPVVRADLESDRLRVGGQDLIELKAHATLRGSTVEVEELTARQAPRGQARPRGPIRASGTYDLASDRYTAKVNTGMLWLDATPELPVSGPISVEYLGEGKGRSARGRGQIVSHLTFGDGFDLGEVTSLVELDGDTAHVTASAPDWGATAEAQVEMSAPYMTTATAQVRALDLGRLSSRAKLASALEGAADFDVEAGGPLENWRHGTASVEVTRLTGGVHGSTTVPVELRRPVRARYDDGRASIEGLEIALGGTELSVSGTLPILDVPPSAGGDAGGDVLLATLTGDVADLTIVSELVDSFRRAVEPLGVGGSGPVTLLTRVSGTFRSPTIEADLEVGPASIVPSASLPPIEQLRLQAHLGDGQIELRQLDATYQGAHVAAQGRAPVSMFTGASGASAGGEAAVTASLTGLTSALMNPFVNEETRRQIAGSLDAQLELRSPSTRLEDLSGELVLNRVDLSVADLRVTQRQPTRVVARSGVARIESWDWESEGTSFTVQGQANLKEGQLAILSRGRFDARLLTPFIGVPDVSTAGRVDTLLSITGPIAGPTVNGDLRLVGGEVRVRQPQIVAENLDAHAILARGQVYLQSFGGVINGGTLSGSGSFQYAPALQGHLTLTAGGVALDVPAGLRTDVDASLDLSMMQAGEEPWSGRLGGLVTITRGSYREPMALLTGLLANLRRSAATGSRSASAFERIALDVRVVTDDDLLIDNNVAQARLGADLRVINTAAAPALSGRAELREGGRLFLGRNTYTVQTGTVDFTNPVAIEPILGIDATTRVSGVDVQVRLSGAPDSLTTDLSSPSNPELGRADLTALLLTGRTLDNLTEQQSAAVGAQLFGNFAGDVLGYAGRAIGLDTLRVGSAETTVDRDLADLATEVDPTSRLIFGKSLGTRVDVTLSQSLRESAAQTWIVDYQPGRNIVLRFVSNDQELRSYEFRHELTFGGPRRIASGNVSQTLLPRQVSAIRIAGMPGVPEAELREVLHLHEGDRFDFLAWQRDRDRLEEFYRQRRHLAARIEASRAEDAKGVALTYDIQQGPETLVRVSGAELSKSALDAIDAAWARSVFDGFLISEVRDIVGRQLARQGFYRPTVESTFRDEGGVRTLDVAVTPGPHVDRIDVRLDGVEDPLKSELLGVLADRRDALEPDINLSAYQQVILDALSDRGHARGIVQPSEPVVDASSIVVPLMVMPGPVFHLAGWNIEGATALPADELRSDVALEEGSLFRPAAVEAARAALQAHARREGFVTATVDARPTTDDATSTVQVAFVVTQGPRQVIADVAVSGLESVDREVVDRALRLRTGDPLRASDWLEARRRLFQTGLFRRVDISTDPLGEPGETAPVRLSVQVEEWPALRVRYGVQVAEERPEQDVNGRDLVPGISGDVTRRTLFGHAISIGGAVRYQRREKLGRLFASAPTLFGLPLRSSVVLERSHEDMRAQTLGVDTTTATWEQRATPGRFNLFYGLRFERNHTFDTAPSPDPNFPIFDVVQHVGRLTGGLTWDTRDDPADSTRGLFASGNVEQALGALGSDVRFIKSLFQVYRFQPVGGAVFASAARLGLARPLGGFELLPSQRFYAGGARTVRGVAEDSLGERDILSLPAGGGGLLVLNQEVRFPIFRWFRGVAFLDAGNIFSKPGDIRVGALVVSSGFGLRVATPFVLLRVDYGKTMWNRPVDDSGRWVFGIGQTF